MRYQKQVPGQHAQIGVKFLRLEDPEGRKVRRFHYTAIDDATRIPPLRIYEKHARANAIDFIGRVVKRLPVHIHTVRTDNGHESQTKSHWAVADQGMRRVYIKARKPRRQQQGRALTPHGQALSSTCSSSTRTTLIWPRSWPPGRSSTTFTVPTTT
jgi:hypothetical protein